MADEPVNASEDEQPEPASGEPVASEASPEPEAAAAATTSEPDEPAAAADASEAAPSEATATLDIGSQAAPRVEIDVEVSPTVRGKIDRHGVAIGTGRRKTAVARVRLKSGTGQLSINGRELAAYFPLERDQKMVLAPLVATGSRNNYDVWVRVQGGGPTGQTGAVVLGIARALEVQNPDFHHRLAEGGFLTRDGRMVERKKYGFKKARRSFQFSKR